MAIYLIQSGADGMVKIGYAADVRRRWGALQTGSSAQLMLLAEWAGDADDEAILHQHFAADRVSGEWFRPTPALLEFFGAGAPAAFRPSHPRAVARKLRRDPPAGSVQSALLTEIEAFMANRRVAETAFGLGAMNDGKFVGRVRAGSNLTLATVDRVRAYIAAQKAA